MHLPTLRGHLDPAQDKTGTMPAVQVAVLGPATKGGKMKIDEIIQSIKSGKTLYIGTCLKTIKIDARCLARFERAGVPVLKDGKEGEAGFYVAAGRRYDYVMPGAVSIRLVEG